MTILVISLRLLDKPALQRCQPVKCGLRQRTFLHRGQRLLELLRRCHTDEDGAHGGVGDGEPYGGLGQGLCKPLLQERLQPSRVL